MSYQPPVAFSEDFRNFVDCVLVNPANASATEPTLREERAPAKVINLMDALRRSVETERGGQRSGKPPVRQSARQRI